MLRQTKMSSTLKNIKTSSSNSDFIIMDRNFFFNLALSAKMEPLFTVRHLKRQLSCQALIQASRELVTKRSISVSLVPIRLDFQPFCEPAFLAPHHWEEDDTTDSQNGWKSSLRPHALLWNFNSQSWRLLQ